MRNLFLIIVSLISSFCFGQPIDVQIAEIRKEYNLINGNRSYIIDSTEVSDYSTEGGQLTYYKDSVGNIKKLVAAFYGEAGQQIEEFYLSEGKLFFAFTQHYEYNRPIYWTDEMAKENGDNEAFDISKSVITENRYYFDNNEILIRYIDENKNIFQESQELEKIDSEIKSEFSDLISKVR
jgi:hypothetical protein